ncbi:Peroxin 13, N-terminal region-domain-containing protein [Lactarius indigo]|nr:Peroxin 13, N-terminal region-domain-containing protein [Lactarius indigo]
MGSPPKPWERSGSIAAAASPSPLSTVSTSSSAPAPSVPISASTTTPSASATNPPSVPARPASFASPVASSASPFTSPFSNPYNRFGTTSSYSPYGSSLYGNVGSLGGYGGYPYGSYGGYGMNSMYGGTYGSMGMGMGGMGMYGQPGMPFDPSNPSVTQALESTTATTFALLHSVVQTFAGLAQMLESTFMATHSSFFALAGVVDQFAQLRNALGSVLGLFGLVRWLRDLLTGRNRSARGEMRGEFREFLNGRPVQGPAPAPPNASKKPLVFFVLAMLGIPYAMHKLVKLIAERAARQQQQNPQQQGILMPSGQVLPPLDPSQLSFARTVYPFQASTPSELNLQENEIVAIMGKLDPRPDAGRPRRLVPPKIRRGVGAEGARGQEGRLRENTSVIGVSLLHTHVVCHPLVFTLFPFFSPFTCTETDLFPRVIYSILISYIVASSLGTGRYPVVRPNHVASAKTKRD